MQGGKNRILPILLELLLAGNLVKPLMSLYGTEWRERGYGLCLENKAWLGRTPPVLAHIWLGK
jgi:hypothetical protein